MPPAEDLIVAQLDAAIAAVARRVADTVNDLDPSDIQAMGVACWHMGAARDNLDPRPRPDAASFAEGQVRKPSDG